MTIFITGIHGFIGSHLAAHLAAGGHEIHGSVSSASLLAARPAWVRKYSLIKLGESFEEEVFGGIEVLVHCAHDLSSGAYDANYAGGISISEAARRMGVSRQIYVSSYSARAHAQSSYGRTKYRLESYFLGNGHTAVRPGLVIGGGGLFLKMCEMIKKYPVLPMLDRGRAAMPVIGIEDLTRALEAVMNRSEGGSYNLFYDPPGSLKDLLLAMRDALEAGTRFIPLPSGFVLALAAPFAWLSIPLPAAVENIKGYRANRDHPARSDLSGLAACGGSLMPLICKAVQSRALGR